MNLSAQGEPTLECNLIATSRGSIDSVSEIPFAARMLARLKPG